MNSEKYDIPDTRLHEMLDVLDGLMRQSASKGLFIERKSRGRHLFWNEWVIDQPRHEKADGSSSGPLLTIDDVYSPEFLDLIRGNTGGELSPRMDCSLCFSDKRLMRGHVRMSNTIEEIKAWLKNGHTP